MGNETRAMQMHCIVQGLATLPGGRTVDVSFKKLPRLGPAEPGTAYQSSTRSFNVEQLPGALSIPEDSEDVEIRLRGSLGGTLHQSLLVDELETIFERSQLHDNWDVRVNFRQNKDRAPLYELTVFPHLFTAAVERAV